MKNLLIKEYHHIIDNNHFASRKAKFVKEDVIKSNILCDVNGKFIDCQYTIDKEMEKENIEIHSSMPASFKKVYIDSSVSCPRNKAREWLKKKNAKIVRDPNKADVLIINGSGRKYWRYFKETLRQSRVHHYETDSNVVLNDTWTETIKEVFDHLFNILDFSRSDEYLIGSYHVKDQLIKTMHPGTCMSTRHYDYPRTDIMIVNDVEKFNDRYKVLTTKTIVKSSSFNKLINADSLVIDDEQKEAIAKMLSSNDYADVEMGVEILANCNYEKSFYNVCDLLIDHSHRIYNSRGRKHINFKGLVDFLSMSDVYRINIYDIFRSAMKNELLTVEKSKELGSKIAEDIKRKLNGCSFLKPDKLIFTEEVLEYFKNQNAQ